MWTLFVLLAFQVAQGADKLRPPAPPVNLRGISPGAYPEFVPPDLLRVDNRYLYKACSIGVVSGRLTFPAYSAPIHSVDIEFHPVNIGLSPNGDGVIPPPVRKTKTGPGDEFRLDQVKSAEYEIILYSPEGVEVGRRTIMLGQERCTNNDDGEPIPPVLAANLFIPLHVLSPAEDAVSIESLKRVTPPPIASDPPQTIASLQEVVKRAPDYYDANLQLGLELKKAGRREEATRALAHALQVNPGSMLARSVLGQYAFEDGHFQQAAELLSDAARLGSASPDVYYMLGSAHYKLDEMDLAEANLWRALAIDPSIGKAYLQLYNVYMRRGLPELALKVTETYLDKYPAAGDREYVQAMVDKLRKTVKPDGPSQD